MAVKEIRNGGPVDKTAFIYGLHDPRDGALRYVGVTVRSVKARLHEHVMDARSVQRIPVHAWISELMDLGLRPVAKTLESVPPGEDWAAAEIRWIAASRADGADLLNVRSGGNGGAGHVWTEDMRQRHSEIAKRRGISEETRAKMIATKQARGYSMSPEERERRRRWTGENHPSFGAKRSAETRARMSAAQKANPVVMAGAENGNARAVIVAGIRYATVTDAAKALGLTQPAISQRLKRGTVTYA